MAKEHGYSGPCLECIFPKCLQEMTAKEKHLLKLEERKKRIIAEWKAGKTVKELAREFKLSVWTIYGVTNGK